MFRRILVVAPFREMEKNRTFEGKFTESFKLHKVQAIGATDVFLPTRTYDDAAIKSALASNGIDGILIFLITDAYSSEEEIPGASLTRGSANVIGDKLHYQSSTYTMPAYSVSKPRLKLKINLYERATDRVAWTAETFTSGNAYADSYIMADSIATTVMKELSRCGIIPEIPMPVTPWSP